MRSPIPPRHYLIVYNLYMESAIHICNIFFNHFWLEQEILVRHVANCEAYLETYNLLSVIKGRGSTS